MIGALDHALGGLQAGFERLDQAARRIAADGAGDDLATNVVDLLQARHQVRANATVVRVADEMVGTLLDVLA